MKIKKGFFMTQKHIKEMVSKLVKQGNGEYKVKFVFQCKTLTCNSAKVDPVGNLILKESQLISQTENMSKKRFSKFLRKKQTEMSIQNLGDLNTLLSDSKFHAGTEIVGESSSNKESFSDFSGFYLDDINKEIVFSWLIDDEHPKQNEYVF
jgi:hypothetical protein